MHDPLLTLKKKKKAVSYYLINGSKLNTKIKRTLKFIPWSIKMYFGLDVNVREKKRSNELFISKIQHSGCIELKTFFFKAFDFRF